MKLIRVIKASYQFIEYSDKNGSCYIPLKKGQVEVHTASHGAWTVEYITGELADLGKDFKVFDNLEDAKEYALKLAKKFDIKADKKFDIKADKNLKQDILNKYNKAIENINNIIKYYNKYYKNFNIKNVDEIYTFLLRNKRRAQYTIKKINTDLNTDLTKDNYKKFLEYLEYTIEPDIKTWKNRLNEEKEKYEIINPENNISKLNKYVKQFGYWGIYTPEKFINLLKRVPRTLETYTGDEDFDKEQAIKDVLNNKNIKFYLLPEDFGEHYEAEKFRNLEELKEFIINKI